MQVKIDTKEKFHVITINESRITANMTADLQNSLGAFLQKEVKNLILNLGQVEGIDLEGAEALIKVQQTFYENNASFVVCELQSQVEDFLDKADILEILSATPSESEAWDIVQMEEIERELFDDEE